jgi:hypothetical protein
MNTEKLIENITKFIEGIDTPQTFTDELRQEIIDEVCDMVEEAI